MHMHIKRQRQSMPQPIREYLISISLPHSHTYLNSAGQVGDPTTLAHKVSTNGLSASHTHACARVLFTFLLTSLPPSAGAAAAAAVLPSGTSGSYPSPSAICRTNVHSSPESSPCTNIPLSTKGQTMHSVLPLAAAATSPAQAAPSMTAAAAPCL
mgnify:CR=1 FL=1